MTDRVTAPGRTRVRVLVGFALLALTLLSLTWTPLPPLPAHAQARAVDASPPPAPFVDEILAMEAADRREPPPRGGVVFVGSSSIRLWKSLAQDFPGERVVNRGFGGSQVSDSVHYADRIVIAHAPRLVVMYAGANDLRAGKSPDAVAADVRAFVRKVHARLPGTRFVYVSLMPTPARFAEIERVREANALVRRFTETDPRLHFVDVFPHMLGSDGQPRSELFGPDRLHMSPAGYALWTRLLRPYVSKGTPIDLQRLRPVASGAIRGFVASGPEAATLQARLVGGQGSGSSGELLFDLRRLSTEVRRSSPDLAALTHGPWGNRATVSAELRVSEPFVRGGKAFWQRAQRARVFVVDARGRRQYLPAVTIVDRPVATEGWLRVEGLVTADVPMPLGFTQPGFDPARICCVGLNLEAGNRPGLVIEGSVELRELRVALRDPIVPRVLPAEPALRANETARAEVFEARAAALGLPHAGPLVGVNLAWPSATAPSGEALQLYGRLLDGGTPWWDRLWDLGEPSVAEAVRADLQAIRSTFAREGAQASPGSASRTAAAPPPVVRLWLFADLRSGISFDADGTPVAISARSRENMRRLLDLARAERVLLVPVLVDFTMADGVGRAGPDGAWEVGERPDLIADPAKRARLVALLEEFVKPFARDEAILAWDVMNEPENAAGIVGPRHFADLQALVRDLVDAVHRAGGVATVGHRNALDAGRFFRDRVASDLGQAHYYPLLDTRPNPARIGQSLRDAFGALPAGWGELPAEPGKIARHLAAVRAAGHRIFWLWAWRGHEASGDGFAVAPYADEIAAAIRAGSVSGGPR